jgi:ribosomal-protein-alanine N-acetyltransferase
MANNFDFSIFPELATDRLFLRKLKHSDAKNLNELFSSPKVLMFSNDQIMNSEEKAIELIDKFNNSFKNKNSIQWAITVKNNDALIGTCGSYDLDRENSKIDIGYLLIPSFWGKGYATEATMAMIKWVFDKLDIHRIQADCTSGHEASENILLKCGFTEEGIWRESTWEHGKYVDIKQFGLLRKEFEEIQ